MYWQNDTQYDTQRLLRTIVFIFVLPYQLTITSQHQRHHRFCLRLLLKHPDSHALCVLCGHNAMVSGSFKHALGIKNVLKAPYLVNKMLNIFTSSLCSGPLHYYCSDDTASTIWYILKTILVFIFRPVCPGLPDSPWQPPVQPVYRSHLLPHGISEICRQTTRAGSAGKRHRCLYLL